MKADSILALVCFTAALDCDKIAFGRLLKILTLIYRGSHLHSADVLFN